MNVHKLIVHLLLLCFFQVAMSSEKARLSLLDIDKIGPTLLNKIKQEAAVEWWLEMGDRMVVASDTKTQLPAYFNVISSVKDVETSSLAIQQFGHCDHSQGRNISHPQLSPVFAQGSFQLVRIPDQVQSNQSLKDQFFKHSTVDSFEKNAVLAFQYENRFQAGDADPTMQTLVQQIDKNRWFSQVEYLTGLDRMLESDLIIAGGWLEQRFADLGLTTSRIDHALYRGFNILGFKQGTSRPDDWYVVGAHLDSRNQNFNDALPSPGAEDNASGCSGVLELANVLSQYDTEASILFMCFVGEERGLLGSQLVVTELQQQGTFQNVRAMFNLDMISYRRGDDNEVVASAPVEGYRAMVNALAENGTMYTALDWQVAIFNAATDHLSFSREGVTAVTTNIPAPRSYFGYHTVNDLSENLDPDYAADVLKANLATLADVAGLDLSALQGFSIVPGHSGLWYDPNKLGHGVTIEILDDNRIVAIWYTYDAEGNPAWLLGVGTFTETQASLEVTYIQQGAFPPSLIPDDAAVDTWGSFQIEFIDCSTISFSWAPDVALNLESGTMQLKQLSRVAGLTCQDPASQ